MARGLGCELRELPEGGFRFLPGRNIARVLYFLRGLTKEHPEAQFSAQQMWHEGRAGVGVWRVRLRPDEQPEAEEEEEAEAEAEDARIIARARAALEGAKRAARAKAEELARGKAAFREKMRKRRKTGPAVDVRDFEL